YGYSWSNGANTSSTTGLPAGTYSVIVTDNHGCTATCSYNVTEPSALSASCSGTNVSCNGGSNGSASVVASGGTPSYNYSWSNGGTSASISGLAAGTYAVTVTDAHGCTATCSYAVSEPSAITASCSGSNVACNGGANGSASVIASGGSIGGGNYSYIWSNGVTTAANNGLPAGTYCVTVTDMNGCSASCCY